MTLREAAREVLEEVRDGIAFIAIYKDGKGWGSKAVYCDYNSTNNEFSFETYDLERLTEIAEKDPDAVLVNPYYNNLGWDENECYITLQDLVDGMRYQYEVGKKIKDILEETAPQETEEDPEEEASEEQDQRKAELENAIAQTSEELQEIRKAAAPHIARLQEITKRANDLSNIHLGLIQSLEETTSFLRAYQAEYQHLSDTLRQLSDERYEY